MPATFGHNGLAYQTGVFIMASKKIDWTGKLLQTLGAEASDKLAKELANLKALVESLRPGSVPAAAEASPAPMTDEELASRPIAPLPACA